MQILFSATARRQLSIIKNWIEDAADAETARRFTNEIVTAALSLSTFPERGSPRPDLPRPRLRSISVRRNVTIVYRVDQQTVLIIAVRYAGQDWPGLLRDR